VPIKTFWVTGADGPVGQSLPAMPASWAVFKSLASWHSAPLRPAGTVIDPSWRRNQNARHGRAHRTTVPSPPGQRHNRRYALPHLT
jgi:hypothetical protein